MRKRCPVGFPTQSCLRSSLELLWLGAQAPPHGLLAWWEERGTRAFTGYGMTESSPQVCFNSTKTTLLDAPEEEQWRRRTSGGLPIPLMRIKIVDETDRELPWDGESVGTVCLRSPYTASGYLGIPEAPGHRTPDGWFRTGDVATIDPDGYVTVKDRLKDLIKSGGEWISSIDLENALMTHPGVRQAMVVGVPHERWQERPVALVELREASTPPTTSVPGCARGSRSGGSPTSSSSWPSCRLLRWASSTSAAPVSSRGSRCPSRDDGDTAPFLQEEASMCRTAPRPAPRGRASSARP